jgi:PPK2 family polyphosphate:nucleotide phosphotransferase
MAYAYRVKPGEKIDLKEHDPSADSGLSKEEGQERFLKLSAELDLLQEELFAAATHSLLIVFQAPDTGGKDGAIRRVLDSFNAQGVRVESFKVPTPEELAHDFLWRVHKVTPERGMVGVFNRSHYEDVLVVRVHNLVPESVWRKRYDQINEFEELLAENNTIILKFFLHISKEEQKERLLAREQETMKYWKLSAGDWKEREFWDDYTAAYEEALSRCSPKHAPWYVVPANRKWFRDLAVAEAIIEALKEYRARWRDALEAIGEKRKAELEEYRKGQSASNERK